MAEELTFEDKKYISSKRASELSGYARDYIGQLARSGAIVGKRVGGLWYIEEESLNAHKTRALEYKPIPPKPAASMVQQPENVITLEGKNFISASRASEITGYHQDYIGQLARAGKISSQQVGTRWYVDQNSLEVHKREKDSLLGAVQAEAVGVNLPVHKQESSAQSGEFRPFFKYESEEPAVIEEKEQPLEIHKAPPSTERTSNDYGVRGGATAIPIRFPAAERPRSEIIARGSGFRREIRRYRPLLIIIGLVAFVTIGVFVIGASTVGRLLALQGAGATTSGFGSIAAIASYIEGFFVKDIIYDRN